MLESKRGSSEERASATTKVRMPGATQCWTKAGIRRDLVMTMAATRAVRMSVNVMCPAAPISGQRASFDQGADCNRGAAGHARDCCG